MVADDADYVNEDDEEYMATLKKMQVCTWVGVGGWMDG